ncbi:MAG: hypothetical protein Tsb0014_20120 [Pleurocapsa sp.]
MNQKLLTVLGCSGSVVLSGLSISPTLAEPVEEYVFNAPGMEEEMVEIPRSDTDYPFYECDCSNYDAAAMDKSDREGDKAIDLYGCDCAGCRNLVRNLESQQKLASQK